MFCGADCIKSGSSDRCLTPCFIDANPPQATLIDLLMIDCKNLN